MRTRDNGNNFKKKTYFEQYCLLRVILHFGPYKSMHQMYFKTILLSTTCISQFLENKSLIFFFWIRFWYNGRLLYIWRGLLVEKLEVFCCSCLSVDLSVTPKFETDISCRLKDKRFHQTQLSIVAWIFFSTSKIQTPPTTFSLK